MKQDQEHKSHLCRFCKQSFSSGKKLGGHMRGHLALISASRMQENARNAINGEKGLDGFDDDDQIIMGIEEHDEEAINGEKGLDLFDDDDDHHHDQIIMGIEHDEKAIHGEKGLDLFDDDDDHHHQIIMGIEENDEEAINGEKGVDFDDEMVKKSQQEMDVDQDYDANNGYVLRENPKKSWRVLNWGKDRDDDDVCKQCGKGFHSSRSLATHMRCHSRTKKTVCEKCGKGFDSVKALYGHMRSHSMIKRSRPLDRRSSSSEEEDDGEQPNPVRKKRSCTRYKSTKHDHPSTFDSLSSSDYEIEGGAICLMMLSRGVRNLDGGKFVISHHAEFVFSDSGSTEFCKDLIGESGSGRVKCG